MKSGIYTIHKPVIISLVILIALSLIAFAYYYHQPNRSDNIRKSYVKSINRLELILYSKLSSSITWGRNDSLILKEFKSRNELDSFVNAIGNLKSDFVTNDFIDTIKKEYIKVKINGSNYYLKTDLAIPESSFQAEIHRSLEVEFFNKATNFYVLNHFNGILLSDYQKEIILDKNFESKYLASCKYFKDSYPVSLTWNAFPFEINCQLNKLWKLDTIFYTIDRNELEKNKYLELIDDIKPKPCNSMELI